MTTPQRSITPIHIDVRKCLSLLAAALSSVAVCTFLDAYHGRYLFFLLFTLLFFPFFTKRYAAGNQVCRSSLLCGLLFSVMICASSLLDCVDHSWMYLIETDFPVVFLGAAVFFEAVFYFLYDRLGAIRIRCKRPEPTARQKLLVFFGAMLTMLIFWFPAFLYLYPGVTTPDSVTQLMQALGECPLSNHHPILHTMIIKGIFFVGRALFHDDIKALALYSVLQMLFMSACFAYLIETLYKFRIRKTALAAVLLCYIVPAYHSIYSVTMWKDIPFAGIVTVFCTLLWRFLNTPEKRIRLRVSDGILLLLFSIGFCLMRSNGLYAFILVTVIAFPVFLKRNFRVPAIIASALVISLIIHGPVYHSMHITPPDPIESLSIPAQQVAAVVTEGGNLTPEQTELLAQIVDLDQVPERYLFWLSDPIKNLVRETGNQEYLTAHKGDYLRAYLQIGLANPEIYLKAFLNQTAGYWYPVDYWVVAFDHLAQEELGLPLHLPSPYLFMEFGDAQTQRYQPFIRIFWHVGSTVWIFFILLFAETRKQRKDKILVFLPVLAIWGTLLIATPVYSEFRYIYSLFCTLPLFAVEALCKDLPDEKEPEHEPTPIPAEKSDPLTDA